MCVDPKRMIFPVFIYGRIKINQTFKESWEGFEFWGVRAIGSWKQRAGNMAKTVFAVFLFIKCTFLSLKFNSHREFDRNEAKLLQKSQCNVNLSLRTFISQTFVSDSLALSWTKRNRDLSDLSFVPKLLFSVAVVEFCVSKLNYRIIKLISSLIMSSQMKCL